MTPLGLHHTSSHWGERVIVWFLWQREIKLCHHSQTGNCFPEMHLPKAYSELYLYSHQLSVSPNWCECWIQICVSFMTGLIRLWRFSLSFFSLICPVAWDLVDNEEGTHSKHFKHWEAGYPVILPTKALKGRMSTTGRILGTNGVGHVGHVGPISVSGHPTWGPKAGNAGPSNPTTYTMDDDDAVEASAPLPRKGGASAGMGHLFLAGFRSYNSICRRLSKTCFLCKNRITLE